jgi:3-oxoadipate enol-lactonase
MFVDVAGVGAINVARVGPRGGAPVVFLHPVGLDATWWGAQFAAFGDARDVVALDMPGHGLSAELRTPPTFERMADVVEGVLRAISAGPAHLVGISVGGMIAQTLAVRRPSLVRSLALVATLCTFPDAVRSALHERSRVARSEGMARIAQLSNERWFPAAFRARRPDVLDRATRSLLQQSGDFHAAMWDMIAGLDLETKIGAIACPTLVVAGEQDVNAPRAAAELITRAIRTATLKVMPGVGHFPPFEAPEAFNAILGGFLAEADAHPAPENA